jgi:hypothetical protein
VSAVQKFSHKRQQQHNNNNNNNNNNNSDDDDDDDNNKQLCRTGSLCNRKIDTGFCSTPFRPVYLSVCVHVSDTLLPLGLLGAASLLGRINIKQEATSLSTYCVLFNDAEDYYVCVIGGR